MSAEPKKHCYTPELQLGAKVRIIPEVGPVSELTATVIRALENPSQRPENQWYDVRCDGGRLRRCHVSFLKSISKT